MKEYFYWTGYIVNIAIVFCLAIIITFFIAKFLYKMFRRTWLFDGYQTLLAYIYYVINHNEMSHDIEILIAFKKNKRLNKMPMPFRKFWFKLIDNRIKELQLEESNEK